MGTLQVELLAPSCAQSPRYDSTVAAIGSRSGRRLAGLRSIPAISALLISKANAYDLCRRRPGWRASLLHGGTNIFFTIGHSTRTIAEFVDLLRESRIDFVVDVRSMPRSRTNPQFNGESLLETLARWQIGYEHIAELGGLRGRTWNMEASPNGFWRIRSFRNYADYALTAPFAAGLARLRGIGAGHRCAIMCAEAVWWRCHRRIISDYLLSQGEGVSHILGPSQVGKASLTPGVVVRGDDTIMYPAESPEQE